MADRSARPAGSQAEAVIQQKREIARRLIAQGLTTRQIQVQLRCSPGVIRQLRQQMVQENASAVSPI